MSAERLAVVADDEQQWISERAARWAEVDAAPSAVAELAEAVYDAGPCAVGRPCYEFVEGRLYEVRLEHAQEVPQVRVVQEVDTTDLPRFQATMKQIAMTVAGALLVLAVVVMLGVGPARRMHREQRPVAHRAFFRRRGGLGVSPVSPEFLKSAL